MSVPHPDVGDAHQHRQAGDGHQAGADGSHQHRSREDQDAERNRGHRSSVGGEKKGKVTDYEEIRGYILVRKPDMLRMIGLFPIVRNKAFDMVSEGDEFKLSIPAKNKFYVGMGVAHPPRIRWRTCGRR